MDVRAQAGNGDSITLLTVRVFPQFTDCAIQAIKRYWAFMLASGAALVLAFAQWLVPSPSISAVLRVVAVLLLPVVIWVPGVYAWTLYRYFEDIRQRFLLLRQMLLSTAGILDGNQPGELRFAIRGIADGDGTVHLVLDGQASRLVAPGALLSLVSDNTLEEWGIVSIIDPIEGLARARPYDRGQKAEFWEGLEDRMKTDPAPPIGFHLEPSVLRNITQRLRGQDQ